MKTDREKKSSTHLHIFSYLLFGAYFIVSMTLLVGPIKPEDKQTALTVFIGWQGLSGLAAGYWYGSAKRGNTNDQTDDTP